MSGKIHTALDRHFSTHRIVFWYDPDGRMRELYETYGRDGVEKIELANNEFRIKYRLIREEPETKFLVYSPQEKPAEADDWLLDLSLAHFVFSTDEAAMYLQELSLPESLRKTIVDRIGFFRETKKRFEPLAALVRSDWSERELLFAMLSIVSSRSDAERRRLRSIDEIVVSLTTGNNAMERWEKVREWNLEEIFFYRVKREYGIELDAPEPRGVLLRLFQNALMFQTGAQPSSECQRAYVFVDGWRDAKSETEVFEETAGELEQELNVQPSLSSLEDDALLRVDLYRAADRAIVGRLVTGLAAGRADPMKTLEKIRNRKNMYWYRSEREETLRSWYDALEAACLLELGIQEVRKPDGFGGPTKSALWSHYTERLHLIDRHYRTFVLAYQRAGSSAELAELFTRIDALYLNDYLAPLADRWQSLLDADPAIDFARRQHAFFTAFVEKFLRDDKPLFVIISDALRWEVGVQLAERITEINRFRVETEALASLVPTYTAHGMAALLPHTAISLDPVSGGVQNDGKNVNGTEGRSEYLDRTVSTRYPGKRACAITAEDILGFSTSEAEGKLQGFDLVYVYSDTIDSTGHNSESGVPAAVEREIERIVSIVRKITNLNRSNILVTADHGFLFSGDVSDDRFMMSVEQLSGEGYRDRRFILGQELAERPGFGLYGEAEPSFEGTACALVAKGLMKIRKQGKIRRYAHGGATLQELAIPVIRINKSRQDDAKQVEISVLGSTDITSPSVALKFFQEEPAGGKILPRRLSIWFESDTHEVISVKLERLFDSKEVSELNRSVTLSIAFAPTAKKYVGKTVYLRCDTVADGGTMIEYKTIPFRLKQLAMDIDFF